MTQLLLYNHDTYDKYEDELNDIDESQKYILDYIKSQNKKLETIEYNIDKIENNTLQATNNIVTCNKYNISYKSLIIGGLVGSVFISPFGYLLGVKAGSIISLSGMLAGSYATYKLQSF